jgi:hypothetical protein
MQPKSLPKIKPSQIETPERFGGAIAQRLWMEIRENNLIFLGVDPNRPDDLKVWLGFLESLKTPDLSYGFIVVEPALPNKGMIHYQDEVDMKNDVDRMAEGLKKALETNMRVAVIVPSIYSSQAIPNNPMSVLKSKMNFQPLSISIAEATLNREEESKSVYPCATGSGDTGGLGSWGCLIQTKSRGLYRKKLESGKYLGLMDQVGATDYLVLLRFVP